MRGAKPLPIAIASNSPPPLYCSTPAAASCCARSARWIRRPCGGPWPPPDRKPVSVAEAPAVGRGVGGGGVLLVFGGGGGGGGAPPPRTRLAAAEMPKMPRLRGGARLLER